MEDGLRVAVVGAGRMGGAMAGTLRRAGVEVVVFNRTRPKAEAVAEATGAAVAATAREAAEGAQVVLSSLADDAAVGAAYTGGDGIVAGLQPDTVVCESSTIDPGTVQRLRPLVEARRAFLLDTPVSGSLSTAEAGQLTIMAGGDAAVLERVRPVLDPLAKQIFHVGGLGSGAVMKLTVNSVLHGLNLALAEGLVLAERAGVARETAYDVFAASAIAAPFVHYKRQAFEHPGQVPVAFSLDLADKDLDLVLALAAQAGAPMDQAATNHRVVQAAVAAGLGDHDLSELATYLRSSASDGGWSAI
jgi:3-hydroxyisobutyrate dehydrogenase-like beta-hydroxyacid dehydrogenase